MSAHDPNADFYATPQSPGGANAYGPPFGADTGSAVPGRFVPAPDLSGNVLPRNVLPGTVMPGQYAPGQFVQAKTPMPTWGKVLIVLGALLAALLVVGILAAVAIPVFLNQRGKAADVQVKQDLKDVAMAEETYFTDYGTYTLDPTALDVAAPVSEIAVVTADTQSYCLAGRDAQNPDRVWYFTSSTGLSATPCA